MVPTVTEDQKRKRRQTEAKKRTQETPRARPERLAHVKAVTAMAIKSLRSSHFMMRTKAISMLGTSGNHEVAGRMMRQMGRQVEIGLSGFAA